MDGNKFTNKVARGVFLLFLAVLWSGAGSPPLGAQSSDKENSAAFSAFTKESSVPVPGNAAKGANAEGMGVLNEYLGDDLISKESHRTIISALAEIHVNLSEGVHAPQGVNLNLDTPLITPVITLNFDAHK